MSKVPDVQGCLMHSGIPPFVMTVPVYASYSRSPSVRASSIPLHSHLQGLSGGKPNSEE